MFTPFVDGPAIYPGLQRSGKSVDCANGYDDHCGIRGLARDNPAESRIVEQSSIPSRNLKFLSLLQHSVLASNVTAQFSCDDILVENECIQLEWL
jgi:hypothetical protein